MMSIRFQQTLMFTFCLSLLGYTIWYSYYQAKASMQKGPMPIPFLEVKTPWVDSLMRTMSVEEKLGQLIIVLADGDTVENEALIVNSIKDYHLGGIIYNQLSGYQKIERSHLYQKVANIPLLMGAVGETNDLSSIFVPNEMMIAAIRDSTFMDSVANHLGLQDQQLGVQMHVQTVKQFSQPVLSPTLHFINKIQQKRVLSCVKYQNFPNSDGLDSISWGKHMAPFYDARRKLVSMLWLDSTLLLDRGVFPKGYDSFIKHNKLREQIKYDGLILGDIPANRNTKERMYDYMEELFAVDADLLLVSQQEEVVFEILTDMYVRKALSDEELDRKVGRILKAKAWSGAVKFQSKAQSEKEKERKPYKPSKPLMNVDLFAQSTTVLQDSLNIVPFVDVYDKKFHVLSIGEEIVEFNRMLKNYCPITSNHVFLDTLKGLPNLNTSRYRNYDPLIIGLNDIKIDSTRDSQFIQSVNTLSRRNPVVIVHFGELSNLEALDTDVPIVHAYSSHTLSQQVVAQVLFSGKKANGKLPIALNDKWKVGDGTSTSHERLAYLPEDLIYDKWPSLSLIDSIAEEGIKERAMPGCQVFVAKSGQVLYHKSFGYHTYGKHRQVQLDDVYDIASLTKVAATTLGAMILNDRGKIQLDQRLGDFFRDRYIEVEDGYELDSLGNPLEQAVDTISYEQYLAQKKVDSIQQITLQFLSKEISVPKSEEEKRLLFLGDSLVIVFKPKKKRVRKTASIFRVPLQDLLTHHSGLLPSMPILKYVPFSNRDHKKIASFYSCEESDVYSVKVAGDYYLRKDILDSLWNDTKFLRVYDNEIYEYSDVNMILMQQAMDSLMDKSISVWLSDSLYEPLGLQTLGYLPRERLNGRNIVPTANDVLWRKQLLRGYVHDQTAALFGGVAGNAGIFSNANDIGILMQMLLNKGTYGGRRFIQPEVVNHFTERKKGHRALGFDMPPIDEPYFISPSASDQSYGHTGFTGTCIWVDPEKDLVFVFLSNRLYPDQKNWKINTFQIRQRIQEVVYKALDINLGA